MPRQARKIPWIDKRGDVYYAFWYDEATRETKRHSLRTRDVDKARERFVAFLIKGKILFEDRDRERERERERSLGVSDALNQYYKEHVLHENENGLPICAAPERQKYAITNLKAFFKNLNISSIDIPASRHYAAARRAGKVGRRRSPRGPIIKASNSTIRRELNVLIAASNHAKRWGRLTVLPSIELPDVTVISQDEEVAYYTHKELETLISAAKGELLHFIVLAYWTGARRGSIEQLDRSQIKWETRRIVLQKPGTKRTKKRKPIVPLLPEMEPSLRVLDEAANEDERERLFTASEFYHPFRDLCESLGFKDRAHPHLLRHSRATHMLQDGISIYTVARQLGDTVETIERVYGHHSAEFIAEEIERAAARKKQGNPDKYPQQPP